MRLVALLLILLTGLARPAAAADGTWTQFDVWNGGAQLAANVERGRLMWGIGLGDDDDEAWARVSVLYGWQVGQGRWPWKLRAGPALKAEEIGWWAIDDHPWAHCLDPEGERCMAVGAGLRLSADRWSERGQWGAFLMADYTSMDDGSLLVGGLTHLPTGLGAQLSIWNEAGGETTPSVMVSTPVTKRLKARLGHKFVEGETFLGFSFSTY